MPTDADTVIDTYILTGLDFEPVLPCEYSAHAEKHRPVDSPAVWLTQNTCPACGNTCALYQMCQPGREWLTETGVIHCSTCDVSSPTDEWAMRWIPIHPQS